MGSLKGLCGLATIPPMKSKRTTSTTRTSGSSSDPSLRRRPRATRREQAGAYERPPRARSQAQNADAASAYSRSSRDRYADAADAESAGNAYSRRSEHSQYTAERKRRKHRHLLRNIFVTILVVLAVGAGAAFAYINTINGNLSRGLGSGLSNVLVKSSNSEPFYILLCGTDQSIDRDQSDSTDGTYRTDTMMLCRVDPVNKKVTLISIPRDTKVTLDGYSGDHKINAAYAYGGSELAVKTVSELAGVDISHFALVDMDGMKAVVDALGGIDVDVPIEINDDMAGGHLDAGEQTLNGDQALILARSRHSYDKYGDGDAYRAANQRLVVSAIAKKLLQSDPATIANTIQTLSQYVQTDMTVSDIVSLGQTFQGFDPSTSLYSATMPNEPVKSGGVWYTEVVEDAWQEMMDRVNQGLPPTEETEVDSTTGTVLATTGDGGDGSSDSGSDDASSDSSSSKDGTVVVRNGNGKSGVGDKVATKLSNAGYNVTDTGNADSFNYKTTLVVYMDSANKDEAQAIADTIGGAQIKQNDGSYSTKGDFLVIIGSDYSS